MKISLSTAFAVLVLVIGGCSYKQHQVEPILPQNTYGFSSHYHSNGPAMDSVSRLFDAGKVKLNTPVYLNLDGEWDTVYVIKSRYGGYQLCSPEGFEWLYHNQ